MPKWSKRPADRLRCARGWLMRLARCGTWHFRHKNPAGKWITRSTGHHDKLGAIRWAEGCSFRATRQEFCDPPPAPRGRNAAQPIAAPPTLRRALALWVRYHRSQSSANTVQAYRSIALKFWRFANPRRKHCVRDVTRELLVSYRDDCRKRLGNTRCTVDNNLIALRSFCSWAVFKHWLAENPASQTRHGERLFFDAPAIRKVAYTRAEFERIRGASTGVARCVFTLLGSWGLRISELAMLEWTDIDEVGRWVHVRNKVTHDGVEYHPKDRTDRQLPLEGADVLAVLDELASLTGRSGYLLPCGRVKSRADAIERHYIDVLKRVSAQTGIPAERLTLHCFRRFFISECADHGVPMATIMDWVGHDEMTMVLHYCSLRDPAAREAMRRLAIGGEPVPASAAGPVGPSGSPEPAPQPHVLTEQPPPPVTVWPAVQHERQGPKPSGDAATPMQPPPSADAVPRRESRTRPELHAAPEPAQVRSSSQCA